MINMRNHIDELMKHTTNLELWYDIGFDQNGNQTVGYRNLDNDPIIDGISWMVCGDTAFNKNTNNTLSTVTDVDATEYSDIRIVVTAQAMLFGSITAVTLGTYKCVGKRLCKNHAGVLVLVRE